MGSTSPLIFSSRTTGFDACSSAETWGKKLRSAMLHRAAMRILRGAKQWLPKAARHGFIERLRWAWSFADARVIVWPQCNWGRVSGRAGLRHAPDLFFSARDRCARAWFARERSRERRARPEAPLPR